MLSVLAFALALPACGGPPSVHPSERLLIDLRDDLTDAQVEAFAESYGLELRLNSPQSEDERMYVAPALRARDILARLSDDPRVEIAERNQLYRLPSDRMLGLFDSPAARPGDAPSRGPVNDPRYAEQWSFAQIGVPGAWKRSQGEGIVVAVIDTGVAFENHKGFKQVEDLAGTAFVPGYNFITDTPHANDDHGHGTHVAGTIAQTTNNGIGVAGIAPRAKIMPLKVLSRRGAGTAGDIADAIRFAADEGAHVINMSLGGGPKSRVMSSAVAYARAKGLVVVCAAGNGARERVEFPAAYPGALAVSSVGPDKKLAYYSSYGAEVSVAAPGGNKQLGDSAGILQNTVLPTSVGKTDTYMFFQGTSMAAPHVAGLAALVMSSGITDPGEVRSILESTANDLGPAGRDPKYGHGLIDAEAAVIEAERRRDGAGWAAVLASLLIALASRLGARGVASAGLGGLAAAGGFVGAGYLGVVSSMLWASVGLPFILVAGLLHQRRLRAALMGFVAGWGCLLLWLGTKLPWDLVGMPGLAGGLDRAWLVMNAVAAGWLAWRIARLLRR